MIPTELPNASTSHDQFAVAMQYLQSGNAAGAQSILEQIVTVMPGHFEALHFLGVSCATQGNLDRAAQLIGKAVSIKPDYAAALFSLGNVARNQGLPEQAIECFRKAVALQPQFPDPYFALAVTLENLNRLDEALINYRSAADLSPYSAEIHLNLARFLKKLRQFPEALVAYGKAIELNSKFAEAHNGLGTIFNQLDRYDEAIASFDKAIELQPGLFAAHYNRGNALYELDRTEDALAGYQRVIEIRPDFTPAKVNRFWLHVRENSDYPLIDRMGREVFDVTIKEESSDQWLRQISDFRVMHDLEQIEYMLASGIEFEGLREAQSALKDISCRFPDGKTQSEAISIIPLSESEDRRINLFRNALFRYRIPANLEYCLNPDKDWQAVEEKYFSSYPEMIYIDDLLAPRALDEFRKFCLLSTVWKSEYNNQYLGAFANMGFISELHLQIARELRQKMPRIFGGQKLEQLWAYKYNSRLQKGINVHADAAKVNLNFWITPDEANLDPQSGGLVVYDIPPPPSWSFEEYNADEKNIYAFLEQNRSGSMKVPYRCNRAVLFNSALFHETDEIHFREGYGNRRINVTYLFGKGLKTQ